MSAIDYQAFARAWQAGWNSHDLDRILAHYSYDIVFHSRKAQALMGDGTIRGKEALWAYWAKALEGQPDLIFTVEDVFEGHEMMVITYKNHRGVLAAETLYFGADGLVTQAAACHREG
ncbi:nuclear transport factor 2 family protein [Roseobacter sp. MH60115]|uniref:nuclear transport factor 2 family protein n=1 Tax=Roseobacter sp. MH60115 TaxID=2785324 RepID=UPI0018A259AB|nr:nuclear transport factor 2 family protein [Roseobacter sp. MH60115]